MYLQFTFDIYLLIGSYNITVDVSCRCKRLTGRKFLITERAGAQTVLLNEGERRDNKTDCGRDSAENHPSITGTM